MRSKSFYHDVGTWGNRRPQFMEFAVLRVTPCCSLSRNHNQQTKSKMRDKNTQGTPSSPPQQTWTWQVVGSHRNLPQQQPPKEMRCETYWRSAWLGSNMATWQHCKITRGNMATLTLCAVHETICCLCTLLIPFVGNITITPSLLPPNLPKPLYIRKISSTLVKPLYIRKMSNASRSSQIQRDQIICQIENHPLGHFWRSVLFCKTVNISF